MRPPGGTVLLLLFAAILGAWWVVLLLWDTDALPTALLGAAVATCAVTGLGLWVRQARRAPRQRRADPDLSIGAVTLACGIAALVVGAELGPWLLLIGGGVVVLGAFGLAREWRTARHAERTLP